MPSLTSHVCYTPLVNTFYLARHGETENNRAHRLSGWVDTPLTAGGLEPTSKVIAKLAPVRIDAIYSSDLGRAFITAYEIGRGLAHSKDIRRLPGLREVDYGDATNMVSAEAYKLFPDLDGNTYYTPPNGESLETMQRRVFETINSLDHSHSGANILLVCHSGVMAAIHSEHLGLDFGQHNIGEAYPHDYVALFTMADGEVASFQEV